MNIPKQRLLTASVLGLALFASSCGADQGAVDTTSPASDTTAVTDGGADTTAPGSALAGGEVFVTGSSTVEPIAVLVSELADEQSGGELAVTVEGPGTGDGFKKFCAGEADVSDASRKIKDEEAALCADAGIEYVEIEIGIDGITVATSPNNGAVECLDRKSTRLNSSHIPLSRMPSSA